MSRLLAILILALPIQVRHIISVNGIDGLVLNQSTLADVKKKFPQGKTETSKSGGKQWVSMHYRGGGTRRVRMNLPKQSSITYTLADQGILFYFANDHKLSHISIWKGGDYVTDKGITVGKNTFGQLESVYGESKWVITYNHELQAYVWGKDYDNISFESDDTLKVALSDSLLIEALHVYEK